MSLHVMAVGVLTADPIERTGAKGNFATATLRTSTDDGPILVSMIAFGAVAETLLAHQQGSTLAVAGRAKLTSWPGRDGAENHGLAVVAETITSAAAARRADTERRRSSARTGGA